MFWFFPPRGAAGALIATDAGGIDLQSEKLVDVEVPPRSNAGTSVNAFAYRDGRPPPGWPDDPTGYGPGEGPRHAEDFHLYEVTFLVYALPPGRWEGYAGPSGSGSEGRDVTDVRFGYFESPGFVAREDRRRFESEFGWPDVGPMRIAGFVELDVVGRRVEAHRREFQRLPSLRSVGFQLPGTRLTLFGWGLAFDELEKHARALERLELGSELHRALMEAQARTDRGFEELHGHHLDDGD